MAPHPSTIEETDKMMRGWEREDRQRSNSQYVIQLSHRPEPEVNRFELSKPVKTKPMQGSKNISPSRVAKRRQKNKAARNSRKK